jgi:hypothetical protein
MVKCINGFQVRHVADAVKPKELYYSTMPTKSIKAGWHQVSCQSTCLIKVGGRTHMCSFLKFYPKAK